MSPSCSSYRRTKSLTNEGEKSEKKGDEKKTGGVKGAQGRFPRNLSTEHPGEGHFFLYGRKLNLNDREKYGEGESRGRKRKKLQKKKWICQK